MMANDDTSGALIVWLLAANVMALAAIGYGVWRWAR